MNLDKMRNAKAVFDGFPDGPEKAAMQFGATKARGFLAEDLPALSDSDRAAVAMCVSSIVDDLRGVSAESLSGILLDTSAAYGLAAIDLLGWNGE